MTFPKPIQWASDLIEALACLGLVAMMSIVALDVVLRNLRIGYVFGVLDLTSIALIIVGGMTIPVAFLRNRQLVVELGTLGMKQANKARLEAVWLLIAAPLLLYIAWAVFEEGLLLHSRGRTLGVLRTSPLLHHSLAALAIGAGGLAAFVVGLYKSTGRGASGGDDL